ncbi:hypothetical protein [uncultured Tateyamaria sp.]|uniref:hypothetical protein n=1 Tax=uncultured Tateyamaria sp. TaxID=455651 RepID=UPI002621B24C|nr:hypothetical protein [uncultured Tateyamaria sp.]
MLSPSKHTPMETQHGTPFQNRICSHRTGVRGHSARCRDTIDAAAGGMSSFATAKRGNDFVRYTPGN